MLTGKITQDTAIAGEFVSAGEIVEVDEGTFRQLKLCGKIESASAQEVEEPKRSAPKFTRKAAAPSKDA